ncbi:hypothetical protein LguiA_001597 [Lonicera macranthoides]
MLVAVKLEVIKCSMKCLKGGVIMRDSKLSGYIKRRNCKEVVVWILDSASNLA